MLGVCYYPEHWPRDVWAEDARRMVRTGLTRIRIGEFAWSRLEPAPGACELEWLDDAIGVLGNAGLGVVLGTPTATPPRWMLDRHPDMLALDAEGRPRKFGSRRHYCFSHEGYRAECVRIVTVLAERYGRNPHVVAWQTDNEYGCHDTTVSFSDAAASAFRDWLRARYRDIATLNETWGNVFWSMEYGDFDQIDPPNLVVTEPNPAHRLDYLRFSSDQVVAFNRLQVAIIRARSDAPILHNYMGRVTDFDHFAVGADLDIAGWDCYPLGFLEDRVHADDAHRRRYARQGDPDFQAFHHDLYRAVGRGRVWVTELQPGPVNWAPYNPAPLPGAVRLWSWEAFAHGAETVCFFRWRQAPMAQEQMHAGLLRPDGEASPGLGEARQVAAEIAEAPEVSTIRAPVSILFDYDAGFAWTVLPHGRGLSYFGLVFETYRAMRSLGLSVDIVPVTADTFSEYRVIAAPGLVHMSRALEDRLVSSGAEIILGPRSGARDGNMRIPVPLPPHMHGLDVTVARVESLRPDMPVALAGGGAVAGYREILEGTAQTLETTVDGEPVVVGQGKLRYVGAWLDGTALARVVRSACDSAGVECMPDLPRGVRVRDTGRERFWFNHDAVEHRVGDLTLAPVSVVRHSSPR